MFSLLNNGLRFQDEIVLKLDLLRTWTKANSSPAPWLLSKGMVKLPFLQALQAISPGRGRHAPVRVQENPEAPDNEDAQENKQQNHKNKCGFLFQRHAKIWRCVPQGHEGWRDGLASIHHPGKPGHRNPQFSSLPLSVGWDHGGCTLKRLSYLQEEKKRRKGNHFQRAALFLGSQSCFSERSWMLQTFSPEVLNSV